MRGRLRFPPGPRGLPFLGTLPNIARDPLAFYCKSAAEYGPLCHTTFANIHVYVASDPSLIEELLVGNAQFCVKDLLTRGLRATVGHGLLTSDGALWKQQRKLSAPAFQPRRMTDYEATMVASAERAFQRYADGERREFYADAMALTLEIVSTTLFGVGSAEEAEQIARSLETLTHYVEQRMFSWRALLPPGVPVPGTRRMRRAKADLDRTVGAIITRARSAGQHADHLLARLMRARGEQGEGMSEQQLHDEALTMLVAGHETSALALMFAVYVLGKNPEPAARLRAEVDSVLGGRAVTGADLARLPYLDAVVRETLRLFPPAFAMAREVVSPFELGGYELPAGSHVLVSPYAVQRLPALFPEPDRFRPERWLEPAARALPRFAYFPFGGGPRICIGNHFALLEVALVLATLVQQLELELEPDFALDLVPVITLRARGGLPVRVHRRARAAAAATPGSHQPPPSLA